MTEKKKKTCTGCKKSLPMSQFYANKTNEDGKSIYCKECTKLNAKKYYQKKMLKIASENNGITIKDDILPTNLISMGERKTELALKLAVIQRLMLTVNSEVRELATYLNEEPVHLREVREDNHTNDNHNHNGEKAETLPEQKPVAVKSEIKPELKTKLKPGPKPGAKRGPKPGMKKNVKANVA